MHKSIPLLLPLLLSSFIYSSNAADDYSGLIKKAKQFDTKFLSKFDEICTANSTSKLGKGSPSKIQLCLLIKSLREQMQRIAKMTTKERTLNGKNGKNVKVSPNFNEATLQSAVTEIDKLVREDRQKQLKSMGTSEDDWETTSRWANRFKTNREKLDNLMEELTKTLEDLGLVAAPEKVVKTPKNKKTKMIKKETNAPDKGPVAKEPVAEESMDEDEKYEKTLEEKRMAKKCMMIINRIDQLLDESKAVKLDAIKQQFYWTLSAFLLNLYAYSLEDKALAVVTSASEDDSSHAISFRVNVKFPAAASEEEEEEDSDDANAGKKPDRRVVKLRKEKGQKKKKHLSQKDHMSR